MLWHRPWTRESGYVARHRLGHVACLAPARAVWFGRTVTTIALAPDAPCVQKKLKLGLTPTLCLAFRKNLKLGLTPTL